MGGDLPPPMPGQGIYGHFGWRTAIMKRQYEEPVAEIIILDTVDVITTSKCTPGCIYELDEVSG